MNDEGLVVDERRWWCSLVLLLLLLQCCSMMFTSHSFACLSPLERFRESLLFVVAHLQIQNTDKEELERRRREALTKAEETTKQKTLELKRKQVRSEDNKRKRQETIREQCGHQLELQQDDDEH